MCACLKIDSRRVPTDYNWCKDPLAPSIDGTVVCIKHHVDGVAVYVRSDDASRHVQPYAVEHLLRLVLPAYDDWGALLGFARRHAAYCSVHAHACSRTLRQAWLVWHTFSRTAQQLHTLYVHAARHSHRKQLRRALHSWHRHHRRAVAAQLHACHNAAARIQRVWRRRVARTRCLHAALQLQAALRRRAVVARLHARHSASCHLHTASPATPCCTGAPHICSRSHPGLATRTCRAQQAAAVSTAAASLARVVHTHLVGATATRVVCAHR